MRRQRHTVERDWALMSNARKKAINKTVMVDTYNGYEFSRWTVISGNVTPVLYKYTSAGHPIYMFEMGSEEVSLWAEFVKKGS